MVEVRVGDGVLVCGRSESAASADAENSPLEQLQARMMLEVAGLAAENVTPEQLAALDASLVAMEGMIDDRTRFLEEDQRFHMAVVVASGNQTLIDLVRISVETAHAAGLPCVRETLYRGCRTGCCA